MLKYIKFIILFISLFIYSSVFASVDILSIKNSWIEWTNSERGKVGSNILISNEKLDNTATEWSTYSKNRGFIDHKRTGQKTYYDYYKINSWFNDRGLVFKNINKTTFSESIGRNNYFCKTENCTETLKNAVYKTFAMYLREKGKKYAPHYNSMINKNFKNIGVGIVLDETKKKYYITIHYSTDIY